MKIDKHDVIAIEAVVIEATANVKQALRVGMKTDRTGVICECSTASLSDCVGTLKVNIAALKLMLNIIEEVI